ncbi:hypothetical protein GCM10010277_39340 [Streptomyces longisporoflavus]|nr:hypothetical protein GCM10010277_39340 [Streptomyces longisporoflavus]
MRLDEALLAEHAQRLTDGGATDPEPLAQGVLTGETAAVGVDTGADLVGEHVRDTVMFMNLSRHV